MPDPTPTDAIAAVRRRVDNWTRFLGREPADSEHARRLAEWRLALTMLEEHSRLVAVLQQVADMEGNDDIDDDYQFVRIMLGLVNDALATLDSARTGTAPVTGRRHE